MPLRQGRAKLWFKTKQEQDQFDDNMISSVAVQSENYDDDNFTPIFRRQRKQFYVTLSDKAKQDFQKYNTFNRNPISYIDTYFSGKRDHTFNREWTIQKFYVGYGVSYLLLRQLPIRNFYARAFIMLFFLTKYLKTAPQGNSVTVVPDQWSNKGYKNYMAYQDTITKAIPSLDNRIPEYRLWQLNQPGYLRNTPHRFLDTFGGAVFGIDQKNVAWDGTWNMPLQGLADPKHKDAKWIDFIYQ